MAASSFAKRLGMNYHSATNSSQSLVIKQISIPSDDRCSNSHEVFFAVFVPDCSICDGRGKCQTIIRWDLTFLVTPKSAVREASSSQNSRNSRSRSDLPAAPLLESRAGLPNAQLHGRRVPRVHFQAGIIFSRVFARTRESEKASL